MTYRSIQAPLRPTYSRVSPVFPTWHPGDGWCLLPHIVWTFRLLVSLQSASGRFRFLVPPSGRTCLSTPHLCRHSRFSDNDSRSFCLPVPTKTLSYDSCVTITIHHYFWTPVVLAIINIIQATLKRVYDRDNEENCSQRHLTLICVN